MPMNVRDEITAGGNGQIEGYFCPLRGWQESGSDFQFISFYYRAGSVF